MDELLERLFEVARLKKKWLVGGAVACIFLLGGGIWFYRQRQVASELESPLAAWEEAVETPDEAAAVEEETSESAEVFVDVKGAVTNPGVYRLKGGDRVQDAVQAAGGFVEEADERAVNLAAKVTDEMCLYVPEIDEEVSATVAAGAGVAAHEEDGTESPLVNINVADKEELKTLQGIGDVKAENILSYREENGTFKSIEEIKKVSGIGDGIFDSLKDAITVD